MFLDHPRGMKGSTIKNEFTIKYGRPLIIPTGKSQSQFLSTIPGISFEYDVDNLPYFRYEEGGGKKSSGKQKGDVPPGLSTKGAHDYPKRKEDWDCAVCGNLNYGWREVCQFGCDLASEAPGAAAGGKAAAKFVKGKNAPELSASKLIASVSLSDLDNLIDPQSYIKIMTLHKTKECRNDKKHDVGNCPYWHNDSDRRRNPYGTIRYTHLICEDKSKGGKGGCREGDACLFAHNLFEQMFHPLKFKTIPCNRANKGCHHAICGYYHTKEEQRRLQRRDPAAPAAAAAGSTSSTAQSTFPQRTAAAAPAPANAGRSSPKKEEQMPELKPATGPGTSPRSTGAASGNGNSNGSNSSAKASGKVSGNTNTNSSANASAWSGWSTVNATGGSVPCEEAADTPSPRSESGEVVKEKENVPATATLQQQVKLWQQRKEFQEYLAANAPGQSAVSTGTGKDAPLDYCCYLSKRIMMDPVIAADGETYERSVIEAWFNIQAKYRSPYTSPATQEVLDDNVLMPNTAIRILIEAWRVNMGAST
jgi:hypothetical protein